MLPLQITSRRFKTSNWVGLKIHHTEWLFQTYRRSGPVSWGWGGGGGLRSLVRIISQLLARKSSGFARMKHGYAQKWPLIKSGRGGLQVAPTPTPTPPRTHMVSNDAERPNVYIFSVNVILIINSRKVLLFDNFPVSFSCHALELSLATQTLLL